MPQLNQISLRQWCVVWTKSDTRSTKGQVRLNSPVNARCRWNTVDGETVDQDGTTISYPRTVPVGIDVPVGSYVWGAGKIADLPSKPVYLEVVGRAVTPNLKNRHPTYVLTLQKASQTLPTVVS